MDTPSSLRAAIEHGIGTNLVYKDVDYDFMLDQLWTIIFEATSALRKSVEVLKPSLLSDKELSCMMILTNCIVDCHASYQSIRSGFHRAAAITARGMLENMSLAIALKADEDDLIFKQYKEDKYHIPNAVTVAKKQFPHLGEVYGILSNKFAHEPHDSIGRAILQQDGKTILLLVPPVSREEFTVQFVLMLKMGMLIMMLGESIEWTFANWVEPTIFYKQIDEKQIQTKECASKSAVLTMGKKLEVLLKERKDKRANVNK